MLSLRHIIYNDKNVTDKIFLEGSNCFFCKIAWAYLYIKQINHRLQHFSTVREYNCDLRRRLAVKYLRYLAGFKAIIKKSKGIPRPQQLFIGPKNRNARLSSW